MVVQFSGSAFALCTSSIALFALFYQISRRNILLFPFACRIVFSKKLNDKAFQVFFFIIPVSFQQLASFMLEFDRSKQSSQPQYCEGSFRK